MKRTLGAILTILVVACRMQEDPPASKSSSAPSSTAPSASQAKGIRFVQAPADDVAATVRRELAVAKSESRELIVYVGATWCEPCQRFHAAAARGELDDALPNLTFLELDFDRDGERLAAAGYFSQFIPLFAIPGPDGRASGRQFDGSIKGPGAVADIAPKLKQLLRR